MSKGRTHILRIVLGAALILTGTDSMVLSQAVRFDDTLRHLLSIQDTTLRQRTAEAFLRSITPVPHPTSDTTILFVYSGTARSVSIAGDITTWNPNRLMLARVPGTTLWFRSFACPSDSRFDYKIVVDSSSWILDPMNPRISPGGFGSNSEVQMPDYRVRPETIRRDDVPHGTIIDSTVHSSDLGNTRPVRIYLPPGYDSRTDSCALIVIHDGPEFITLAGLPDILDNLIADGAIPPTIAVCIPPVERHQEYAGTLMIRYAAFLTQDVLPGLLDRFRIRRASASHIVMGASDGGNIALFMAVSYPGEYGRVAAFSSNVVGQIPAVIRYADRLPLAFYLDIGTFDIPQLIPLVRSLHALVQEHGYPVLYQENHDGHSWANWRDHIGDALRFLFTTRNLSK